MNRKMIFVLPVLLCLPISMFGSIDRFIGQWRTTGRGLTRIQIYFSGNQLQIHTFGSCVPQDCDWGVVSAQAYAPNVSTNIRETTEAISAFYETTFVKTLLIVYPADVNQLRVEAFSVFTDRSGRSPYHMTTILKRAE